MNQTDHETILLELRARQQIHDALMRYCRGIDRLDRELMLSAYHSGALDNHGIFNGTCEAFVDWVVEQHAGKVLSCMHFTGNELVEFDGDIAHCESYAMGFHRVMIDGILHDRVGAVRYIDRFEKRGGEWRIADRLVVLDWSRVDPVAAQVASPAIQAGLRSRDDLSYRSIRGLPICCDRYC